MIKITKTLQGDFVEFDDGFKEISAIINLNRWFSKIKLLKAEGLNYEAAKEEILEIYTETKSQQEAEKFKKVRPLSFSEYEDIIDINNNNYARYEALVDGDYIKELKE